MTFLGLSDVNFDNLKLSVLERSFACNYSLVVAHSSPNRTYLFVCEKAGLPRSTNDVARSRKISCPFRLRTSKVKGLWKVVMVEGEHNHPPYEDMSASRAFRTFLKNITNQQ
ncbi:hypothetical protein GEMRC1_005710 [Eukaryota sp. GEM-RC1]